jgi:drug/metabolite transporter (DMT)-like permease
MSAAGSALVAAETILALTPIAIKQSPLDPVAAVFSRTLSSAVLGYLLTSERTLPSAEWGAAATLGGMNLLHIASSYEAFRNLPAGQAMSILYTYPLWNLIFMGAFGNEPIAVQNYAFIATATIGSFMLNLDPGNTAPSALGKAAVPSWGLVMALIMALSESGMVVLLKLIGWRDPTKSVYVVNAGATVWLGFVAFLRELMEGSAFTGPLLKSGTWGDAAWLTAFHSITMFSGYWLRFYAVPRLSTTTYAILSYAGLLASYFFGLVFLREQPGWLSIAGAAVIVLSGLALQVYGGGKIAA